MTGRAFGWDPESLERAEKRAARERPDEQDIPFPDSKPRDLTPHLKPDPPGKPKKRATFSSTAETLKWARGVWGDEAVGISSWWQSAGGFGGVRKDLLGFIDCIVLDGLPGVLALQACGADVSAHKKKLDGEIAARRYGVSEKKLLKEAIDAAKLAGRVRRWLAAGNRLVLVSWRQTWVKTSEKHKTYKRAPRFLEAVLTEPPPGLTLGLSDREVEWIESDTYPERRG